MSEPQRVDCRDCRHFRSAPFEARLAGCYLAKNMPSKQKQACLDEQQIPGDHERINFRGDCPDFVARPRKPSMWQRLWSVGA
jgi:hypothetical protein